MDVWRNPVQSSGMSEEDVKLEKGARVAITGGRKGAGMRGEIFWIGENKYGPGMRYGVRGDDAVTYWVDEEHLGPETAVPKPPEPELGPALEKGQRVEIVKGPDKGVLGEVFWVGDSKFGPGKRYGIKGDDEETYWADEQLVEPSDAAPPERAQAPAEASAAPSPGGGPPPEEAPFPDDAPFPEEGAPAADPFDDDVPFPGDDVPF